MDIINLDNAVHIASIDIADLYQHDADNGLFAEVAYIRAGLVKLQGDGIQEINIEGIDIPTDARVMGAHWVFDESNNMIGYTRPESTMISEATHGASSSSETPYVDNSSKAGLL